MRRIGRHLRIAVLPVLLSGVIHAALPDATTWLELDTAHFTILSQSDEAETRRIAVNLETFYQALPVIAPELTPRGMKPSIVFAFRDEEHFAPYEGKPLEALGPKLGGVFYGTDDANYIAFKAGLAGNPYAVVYHELIHDVAKQSFPPLPVWLNEGLADYYSTFWFEGSDVEVGRPVVGFLRTLGKSRPLALRTLFNVTYASPDFGSPLVFESVYPSSWLVVHYLMSAGPEPRAKLDRYLAARKEGKTDATAHLAAFGFDYKELEAALAQYLDKNNFRVVSRTLPDLHVEVGGEIHEASRARLLSQLGSLLTAQGAGAVGAEEHLRAALEAEPKNAQALAALAFLRAMQGRFDDSARLFDQAVSLGADDPVTLFRAAKSLLFQAAGPTTGGSDDLPRTPPDGVLRARALLERGLARAPDHAEAYADLGRTYLYQNQDALPGIAAFEKARALRPARAELAWGLARLYLLHGDREKAQALVDGPIAAWYTPEEVDRLRELFLRSEVTEAAGLVAGGSVEAGLARYRQVLARSVGPLHERIEAEIARVEGVAAKNREIAAYNEAVGLARKGELAGAVAALEKLSKSCKEPDVCREARGALAKLKEAAGRR